MTPAQVVQLERVAGVVVGAIIAWEIVKELWRRWRSRPRQFPPVGKALAAQVAVAAHDPDRYYHAILTGADGIQRVLYQGRSAVDAKRHYYRTDVRGEVSFWDGPNCRGTRTQT